MHDTTYHRDDTVTIWDVYRQSWRRTLLPEHGDRAEDIGLDARTLASLGSERDRILIHCCVAPRDYVIAEASGANWHGIPAYRSLATAPGRGYRTESEAEDRAREIRRYCAGRALGSPSLTVIARDKRGRAMPAS